MDSSPSKRLKVENYGSIASVVLTGGPCAGKTTALSRLKQHLTEQGYQVFTIPEIPTLLFTNGAVYPGEDPSRRQELLVLETTILKLQMSVEDSFLSLAKATGKKCVLLCDRGVIDCKAYMPSNVWEDVIKMIDIPVEALLSRYVAICHLVTAANGAEAYYTVENNAARIETAQEAIILDQKTQDIWRDHRCHIVIHNTGRTFDEKITQAEDFIREQVEAHIGKGREI